MRTFDQSLTTILALAVLLSGASVAMLSAQTNSKPAATAVAQSATAGDIAANPANYYGKKVTVRAEVEDILGPQVFLLDEDRLFAWPDVMVIAPKMSTPVDEDTMVTVTGTVRAFVDADFRRYYDWNWWDRLDPDYELTFRNRPVIVADSIKTSQGAELVRR